MKSRRIVLPKPAKRKGIPADQIGPAALKLLELQSAAGGTQKPGRSQEEGRMAKALTKWRDTVSTIMPEVRWLYAVPNGGHRDPIVAAIMKAEGAQAGVWDYCLPVVRQRDGGRIWPGLYIELKAPDHRRAHDPEAGCSEKQLKFGAFVRSQGYKTAVCYSWDDARMEIENYLALPKLVMP